MLLLLLLQVGSRASLVDSRSHSTGADVLLSLSSTPNTQGTRKGKEEGKGRNNERKGIRKITGPTLWNYDSTSLILELKPLYCFWPRLHVASYTHNHTQLNPLQIQLQRGELPLESTNCQLPKGPTPNLQIMTFRNSMPVSPLSNPTCNLMNIDIVLRNPPYVKGDKHSLRLGVTSCSPCMIDKVVQ